MTYSKRLGTGPRTSGFSSRLVGRGTAAVVVGLALAAPVMVSAAGASAAPAAAPALAPCAASWSGITSGVGGVSTYSKGELIAQDYIYDDHGATTKQVPLVVADTQIQPAGSYIYPGVADPSRYLNNAADIREVRMRLEGDSLAVRVELNTLAAPDTTVFALALDTDGVRTGSMAWPHAAGLTTTGTDAVVTMWGKGADVTRRGGSSIPLAGACANVAANVLEVRVPLSRLGGSNGAWRVHAAAGLWDGAAKTWQQVLPAPTETTPGGADSATAERAFDIAFVPGEGPLDGAPAVLAQTWFDRKQATALAAGNIDAYAGTVDLALLRARAERPWRPVPGLVEMVYRSSTTIGPDHEGYRPAGPLQGRYQPYTLYVPTTLASKPLGLFEFFHGVTRNHTHLVTGPNMRVQLGDKLGLLLIGTLGRGGSGGAPSAAFAIPQGYRHAGLLDGLEVLADVQKHFPVDRTRQYVGGYSLGGIATRELLGFYPDKWAGAVIWAGTKPDGSDEWLRSTRRVPTLLVHAPTDEVVGYGYSKDTATALKSYGYMYQLNSHVGEHEHQAITDDYRQPAGWFTGLRAPANPARVTFTRAPAAVDDPALGIRPDSAYWLSNVRTSAAVGTIDLISYALAGSEPGVAPFGPTTYTGPPDPYYSEGSLYKWPGTRYAAGNRLGGRLTAIDGAVVDSRRAGLDLTRPVRLVVATDRAATLGLTGCAARPRASGGATVTFARGVTEVRFPKAGSYDVTLTGCAAAGKAASGGGAGATPASGLGAAASQLPRTGSQPALAASAAVLLGLSLLLRRRRTA